MPCLPRDKSTELRQQEYLAIAKKFQEIPEIKQLGPHAVNVFRTIRDTVVGDFMPETGIPSEIQLAKLRKAIDREVAQMNRGRGFIAEWAYLPKEIFEDVGFVRDWYRSVERANNAYKGNSQRFQSQLNDLYVFLKDAAFDIGGKSSLRDLVPGARTKAQRDLAKMNANYLKYKRQGMHREARKYYRDFIEPFVTKGEGRVFKIFHEIASAPKSNNGFKKAIQKHKGTISDKALNNIANAAQVWRNKIQPKSVELMIKGLENYKYAFTSNKNLLGKFKNYEKALSVIDNLLRRYSSGELQKDGYFPIISLDVMPTLAEASSHLFPGYGKGAKNESNFDRGVDLLKNLESMVDKNLYIHKNLKEQSKMNENINYNVLPLMDSYAKSAARFNYVAFNNNKYMEVTKDLWDTLQRGKDIGSENSQLDKKLRFLEGYISDTHSMLVGTKNRDSQLTNNIARTITAFQFASKLGLNIRGAVRNSTQSLYNYVYFGHKGIKEAKTLLSDAQMKTRVQQGLENNGTLFGEIPEIYADFQPKIEYDAKTGTYREKLDLSASDMLAESMSQVAAKLGKPMQWVENNINRRWTFQLGYSYAWKADSGNKSSLYSKFDYKLKRELKKERRKESVKDLKSESAERNYKIFEKNDATEYEFRFEQWRRERAELEANNIVNLLHYDYAMTAKSKILSTKVGSVLGQFQHYGISYFNLQRNIIRKGKEDVFTGNWNGTDAYRMYRLGSLHLAVYGLFAPLLNIDLTNLVQNDTIERIKSYHDVVLGDEETKQRAFFGKGPIIGTFGGPFISDMINLGSLAGIQGFEEDDFLSYLLPMQDDLDPGSSEWKRKLLSTLNTQAARAVYSTYPKWREGTNLGVLIQSELGLFPDKNTREIRDLYNKKFPALGPDPEKKKKKNKKETPKFSANQGVLDALNTLAGN